MGGCNDVGWNGPGDADEPEWDDDWAYEEYGPPSRFDDRWFTHQVAALGHPYHKAQPEMNGQRSIYDELH